MTYRPIDSKREEFRKYLERGGVMDALTKVLVALYEEADKPEDALDYVRKNLGESPDVSELASLRAQTEADTNRLEQLQAENTELKQRLDALEPAEQAAAPAEPQAE